MKQPRGFIVREAVLFYYLIKQVPMESGAAYPLPAPFRLEKGAQAACPVFQRSGQFGAVPPRFPSNTATIRSA